MTQKYKFTLADLQYAHSMTETIMGSLDIQICSLCGKKFVGRKEKDSSIISGKNPLTFAHDHCWQNRSLEL